MPAPRLLILADPKTLPALAGGLREGGRFDVTAVSLTDPAAAQAASERADAVALFYGAPGAPLSAAVQALAPKLRDRGGRVLAVLQREQTAQRDDCFRAGASDLLFMPMPKDQFVARLAGSVALAFAQEGGAPAAVGVATRGSALRLDRATVSQAGVEATAQLPLKPGETVRLSWGSFQTWGLVVRGGPTAQIRFAGLAPDEDAKIREWLKAGAQKPAVSAEVQPPAPPQPHPPAPAVAPQRPATRAAPGAGPPPGFADRKPVRPQTGVQSQARPAPRPGQAPLLTPPLGSTPVARSVVPESAAQVGVPSQQQNGDEGFANLFDGNGASAVAAVAVEERPAVPQGPPWPAPVSAAACKAAALQLLVDEKLGRDVPLAIAASARKITGMLSVGERAWIEQAGGDSHFADVLAARIALDAATAEGTRLSSGGATPVVDSDALALLTKVADEAGARLQKEANAAIASGEVETLQLVTAASASLSRDLLNLKEAADRLRGLGAAPRLGSGSLDPDMVLPGQQPRPRPPPGPQAPAPERAELRDFRGLDHKPGRAKPVVGLVVMAAAIGLAANAFYFGVPHHQEVAVESTGAQRISVTGPSAQVTVTPEWVAARDANLPRLLRALRDRKVQKAVLVLPDGSSAGILDVASGKAMGMAAPAAR